MEQGLLKTPLYNLHKEMGAKMVSFAGYYMPVHYELGVKQEHLYCRSHAGIFDVSHMGQIRIKGKDAAQALERILPLDLVNLPQGKQKYGFFIDEKGGILDDFMISRLDDHFFLVVNAATKLKDIAYLRQHLPPYIEIELLEDKALIAVQGPEAIDLLSFLNPDCQKMRFLDIQPLIIANKKCIISRAGYTGEDGFEISLSAKDAVDFVSLLLEYKNAHLVGLGARDSLRLEAGLCLYGHDISEKTTPIEAGLKWVISPARRINGIRAGGFIGAEALFSTSASKATHYVRVGLIGQSKAPVREGTLLFDNKNNQIGKVTSGTFSPTKNNAIAMAYIDPAYTEIGTRIFADVRGKMREMKVEQMPFITLRYYRG